MVLLYTHKPRPWGHASLILPPTVDAEVLELPVEGMSCLAVCQLMGTIVVGSDKMIRLFTLQRGRGNLPMASLLTGSFSIVTNMDVVTDMKLKKICICGHYLACLYPPGLGFENFNVGSPGGPTLVGAAPVGLHPLEVTHS